MYLYYQDTSHQILVFVVDKVNVVVHVIYFIVINFLIYLHYFIIIFSISILFIMVLQHNLLIVDILHQEMNQMLLLFICVSCSFTYYDKMVNLSIQ
jgi:hypothetical protein